MSAPKLHPLDDAIAARLISGRDASDLYEQVYRDFWGTEIGRQLKSRGVDVNRLVAAFNERFSNAHPFPSVPFVYRWEQIGRDLLVAELPEAQPAPPSEPTEEEKVGALLREAENDLVNPAVSTRAIKEKCSASADYKRAHNIARQKQVAAGFHAELPVAADTSDAPSNIKQFAHVLKRSTVTHDASTGRVVLVVDRDDAYNVLPGDKQHTYIYPASEFSVLEKCAREWGLL